jgi:hypothetical protein
MTPEDIKIDMMMEEAIASSEIAEADINFNQDHVCESDGLEYLSYPPQWRCKICGKFYKSKTKQ